jgi:hypothetical protein
MFEDLHQLIGDVNIYQATRNSGKSHKAFLLIVKQCHQRNATVETDYVDFPLHARKQIAQKQLRG